ncbi:hypothetical protein [Williamwhitmania taraxaci]|uniref:Capsule assembly protein Wzi n=1 Tax=Williamwhitmania taraxaci TaxID=1640674 RepID=A0A1G6P4C4_9BACT|nr:hypothetical protein [Williamwhitmania taraxaci]SDC74287.1 Capsule assembly protein Wzi [Williamwhitmania taraxaci]
MGLIIVKKAILATAILAAISLSNGVAQEVPVYLGNKEVYLFIEELASVGMVDVNSAVKPWSRKQIATFLVTAQEQRNDLTTRQQKMLDLYLKDFGKELHSDKNFDRRFDAFYYKDTLFAITINPVMGAQFFRNSNGNIYHRWVGAETYGYIGNGWGFYSSLRDNHESERISEDSYLTQRMGANYKATGKGGDYSEMRGGITYSWKWGSVMVGKDHYSLGTAYNGTNILSGRTPSFPILKLRIKPVKWAELNYMHGWLVSEIIDSTKTTVYPGGKREVFHPKYISANMITITPFKRLSFSFGNSIIYSDQAPSPAYLAPLFFYKSVDHTLNGTKSNDIGQNSQMFMDISSHQIKHLHLYATLFIDEISLERMRDPNRQSNYISFKSGGRLSGWPIKNVTITAEYMRTNPQVFKHYEPTTTFESNKYNLGNYLTDNADEIFTSVEIRPYRGLKLWGSYTKSRKGPDTSDDADRIGIPFMKTVVWKKEEITLGAMYQVYVDSYIFVELCKSSITDISGIYTPTYFKGDQNTISFGMNYGF